MIYWIFWINDSLRLYIFALPIHWIFSILNGNWNVLSSVLMQDRIGSSQVQITNNRKNSISNKNEKFQITKFINFDWKRSVQCTVYMRYTMFVGVRCSIVEQKNRQFQSVNCIFVAITSSIFNSPQLNRNTSIDR